MKKRTIITTEKREVWVIRPLPDESEEERREEAVSSKNSLPDKVEEKVESSEEKE